MKYLHAMLDIETLSTHTSRAVVLSFGVVPFNLTKSGPVLGQRYMVILNALKQIAAGRRVDQSTIDFWAKQSKEARAHWLDPKFSREGVIVLRDDRDDNGSYIMRNLFDLSHGGLQLEPEFQVWSNGAVFDFGNLENLMDFSPMGGESPWPYRAVRDMRSVIRVNPEYRIGDVQQPGPEKNFNPVLAHDPVADCEWQIAKLWQHMPEESLT